MLGLYKTQVRGTLLPPHCTICNSKFNSGHITFVLQLAPLTSKAICDSCEQS